MALIGRFQVRYVNLSPSGERNHASRVLIAGGRAGATVPGVPMPGATIAQIVAGDKPVKIASWSAQLVKSGDVPATATLTVERQTGGTFANMALPPDRVDDSRCPFQVFTSRARTVVLVEPTTEETIGQPVALGDAEAQSDGPILLPPHTAVGFRIASPRPGRLLYLSLTVDE